MWTVALVRPAVVTVTGPVAPAGRFMTMVSLARNVLVMSTFVPASVTGVPLKLTVRPVASVKPPPSRRSAGGDRPRRGCRGHRQRHAVVVGVIDAGAQADRVEDRSEEHTSEL